MFQDQHFIRAGAAAGLWLDSWREGVTWCLTSQSSVFGPRPPLLPSHSMWKSQPSSRWRYVARTSRYSGATSDSSPGNRTGDSLMSSCTRGPRWQSYRTKSRLAAYGTIRLVRKLLPEKRTLRLFSFLQFERAKPKITSHERRCCNTQSGH